MADPARRAERHVGNDVVAVRAQHRLVGLDLVVRLVQQREVQAESQQKKCHRGDRQMDGQLQYLGNARDVDESQCGVDGEDRRGEARQRDADIPPDAGELLLGGRVNHSAAPISPPTHAAVSGTATPRMPASTMSELTGRARVTIPVANCGASRVRVAAAVKASAPSAPIMKPSMDSRVGGRSRRTTTTGTNIKSMLPTGMPSPSRAIRSAAIPVPSGTPYERATIAPVSRTQPMPSPMPSAVVRSSVRLGTSRKTLVSRMYNRNNSGRPSDRHRDQCRGHTQGRERDQREQHDDKRQLKRSSGPVRQLRKD